MTLQARSFEFVPSTTEARFVTTCSQLLSSVWLRCIKMKWLLFANRLVQIRQHEQLVS